MLVRFHAFGRTSFLTSGSVHTFVRLRSINVEAQLEHLHLGAPQGYQRRGAARDLLALIVFPTSRLMMTFIRAYSRLSIPTAEAHFYFKTRLQWCFYLTTELTVFVNLWGLSYVRECLCNIDYCKQKHLLQSTTGPSYTTSPLNRCFLTHPRLELFLTGCSIRNTML
jgi:hypothetical protein